MSDNWVRKREILGLLSSEHFVSGEELATQLGISRAAVSKHVDALEDYGVAIYSVKGRGYKLANPISLIDSARLIQSIDNRCFYFDEIPSTNGFMLSHTSELKSGDVCVAEYQSAGRGRRGRIWVSPYGHHLYFSQFWSFPQGMAQAMGLSLVVACSLVEVLKSFGVDNIGVKWPNDIYLNYKKLAGILIEMSGQADSECQLIIGIGVNMAMSEDQGKGIDQPWSDLSSLTDMPNKTDLVIALHKQLKRDIQLFEREGLAAFKTRWQQADLFHGKEIRLLMGENHVDGICRGIDEQGAVLLETADGIQAYIGGEISLRAR
ncbi:bifunctional biotin--[acetyl-CoA-carboxylase] ligase/biotin operon repressor BirA [Shewanella xiamenensis]|uniref:bifunctional biotin--[acetyl-CoA-carboxylase] ligase/biotin operon repressor BirA n=1 Tax=Shewanella xiamenensis TaxID=332186 RepID=UPI000DB1856D|nr:bifunctional biotin--[acetyl-CoA-carboxylase] ligase/biotin operon repressor BirA [Shewanella xiamenensis]MCT8865344.1 bifunctional biotin--[acetyl-CoA-carboxylase] ligase/biotin operon repressor BirA [Shewanella xiamenensis]MCT8878242.1 bifunctional biotin--[acetyl-CoA-carboxylase] ligase/biotin operon repressor BirA [Shewanella xiamenensis]MEE1981206.1 bifunctional biotin--[acetyl-CoA-carboxylase] ligase/biotin operon repressor BirA [Shewanella xiamenensis]PZP27144.1 MAG: biotin--[acetyl-C